MVSTNCTIITLDQTKPITLDDLYSNPEQYGVNQEDNLDTQGPVKNLGELSALLFSLEPGQFVLYDGDLTLNRSEMASVSDLDLEHLIVTGNFNLGGDITPNEKLMPFAVQGIFSCRDNKRLFSGTSPYRLPHTKTIDVTKSIKTLDELIDWLPGELDTVIVQDKLIEHYERAENIESAKPFFERYNNITVTDQTGGKLSLAIINERIEHVRQTAQRKLKTAEESIKYLDDNAGKISGISPKNVTPLKEKVAQIRNGFEKFTLTKLTQETADLEKIMKQFEWSIQQHKKNVAKKAAKEAAKEAEGDNSSTDSQKPSTGNKKDDSKETQEIQIPATRPLKDKEMSVNLWTKDWSKATEFKAAARAIGLNSAEAIEPFVQYARRILKGGTVFRIDTNDTGNWILGKFKIISELIAEHKNVTPETIRKRVLKTLNTLSQNQSNVPDDEIKQMAKQLIVGAKKDTEKSAVDSASNNKTNVIEPGINDRRIIKYISKKDLAHYADAEQKKIRKIITDFNVWDATKNYTVDLTGAHQVIDKKFVTKHPGVFAYGRQVNDRDRFVFKLATLVDKDGNNILDENNNQIHIMVSVRYFSAHGSDYNNELEENDICVSDEKLTAKSAQTFASKGTKYFFTLQELNNSSKYEKIEYNPDDFAAQAAASQQQADASQQQADDSQQQTAQEQSAPVTKDLVQQLPAEEQFKPVDLTAGQETQEPAKVTNSVVTTPAAQEPIKQEEQQMPELNFKKLAIKEPTPVQTDYKIAEMIANLKLDQKADIPALFNLLFNFEYLVSLIPNMPAALSKWARGKTGYAGTNLNNTVSIPVPHAVHVILGVIFLNARQDAIQHYINNLLNEMDTQKLNNFAEFIDAVKKISFDTPINFTETLANLDRNISKARQTNDKNLHLLRLRKSIIERMRDLIEKQELQDAAIANLLETLSSSIAVEQTKRPENKQFSVDDIIEKVKSEYHNDFDQNAIRDYIEKQPGLSRANAGKIIVGQVAFDQLVKQCIKEIKRLEPQEQPQKQAVVLTKISGLVSAKTAQDRVHELWPLGNMSVSGLVHILPNLARYLVDSDDKRKISDFAKIDQKHPENTRFVYEKLEELIDIIKDYEDAYITTSELEQEINAKQEIKSSIYQQLRKNISEDDKKKWFTSNNLFRTKYLDEYSQWIKSEYDAFIKQRDENDANKGIKIAELKSDTMKELEISGNTFDKLYTLFRKTDNNKEWFNTTAHVPNRRLFPKHREDFIKWLKDALAEKSAAKQSAPDKANAQGITPAQKPADVIDLTAQKKNHASNQNDKNSEKGLVYIIGLDYQINKMIESLQSELDQANSNLESIQAKSDAAQRIADTAQEALDKNKAKAKALQEREEKIQSRQTTNNTEHINWLKELGNLGYEMETVELEAQQETQKLEQAKKIISETAAELTNATNARDSIKERFNRAKSLITQRDNALSEKALFQRMVDTRDQDAQRFNDELIKLLGGYGSLGD